MGREGGSGAEDRRLPPAWAPPGTDAETAVAALYRTQWARLVRLASLLTGDASIAEEIVQDSFVRLHRRWSSVREPEAALGYLRASVVNASRSALRHRGVTERLRPLAAPPPSGPEERALDAVRDAAVMTALRRLPRRQREVLVLRYFADLDERQIASTLGIGVGSVKSHAHRGLASLRSVLSTIGDDGGSPRHEEGDRS